MQQGRDVHGCLSSEIEPSRVDQRIKSDHATCAIIRVSIRSISQHSTKPSSGCHVIDKEAARA
jgi:hypothetical protein